jgi:hypothetical protein
MGKRNSLVEKIQSAVPLVIAILTGLISIADFFDLFNRSFWFGKLTTMTLFLMSMVAIYLTLDRQTKSDKLEKIETIIEEKSENLEKNLSDGMEHVISSLQGVSAKVFHNREEFWAAVNDSIGKAKKSVDVTRLRSDESAGSDYYDSLEKAVKQRGIKLRRVIVLQDQRMIDQAYSELEDMQSFEYKLGVYDIGWRDLPPVMNLIIIDDREIYAGGGYMSSDQKSASFYTTHLALTKSFGHFFETLWQQSKKLHTSPEFNQFIAQSIPELSILRSYEEIYGISSDIALATNNRLWVTGFTPEYGDGEDKFSLAVGNRLKAKKDIEYKILTCIRHPSDIERQLSDWKEFFSGTNCIVRALVKMPYFIDVLIRDEEELLIGITAREAFDGYTKCLRIRNPEVVNAVADWYNIHLWSSATEIIGKNGPNENGIIKIKKQLAIFEKEKY